MDLTFFERNPIDPLFGEAASFALFQCGGKISTSSLQRYFSIDAQHAGKIIGQMEAAGIARKMELTVDAAGLSAAMKHIAALKQGTESAPPAVPFHLDNEEEEDERIFMLKEKIRQLEERIAVNEKLINALLKIDIQNQ